MISPFGAGGINAYAYCEGDPINFLDTDGRMKVPVIPSPWTSRQPYGVSWRSHAIQRAPKPTPTTLSAMSALVDTIPVNGSHPLYLKMAGRETSGGGGARDVLDKQKTRNAARGGVCEKHGCTGAETRCEK